MVETCTVISRWANSLSCAFLLHYSLLWILHQAQNIADSLKIYFKQSVCSYCLGIRFCLNPIWNVKFRDGSGPISAVNLFKRFYGIIWWFNEPECFQFIFMRSVNHLVLGCWTCRSLAKYLYYECWISERTFNYNALAMLQSVTNTWKVIANQ